MKFPGSNFSEKLSSFFVSPGLEPALRAARIQRIERDIILPIKALVTATLLYYFYFSHWLDQPGSTREVAFETIRKWFLIYIGINLIVAAILIRARRIPLNLLQWLVYTMGLLDALLFAGLTFVTDGFDSIVYWIFPGLVLRNAISIPLATPQIVVNLAVCFCYLFAGILDVAASKDEATFLNLDTATRLDLKLGMPENPTEPFILRVLILLLWTFCCYGVQFLLEKHRRAMEEAMEFAGRQEQLQTAGRLAAEIAHRIKNPLAIINTAAFSLGRQKTENASSNEQIQIIREEVERADRILIELMGYAKLAEGRVEKLDVIEELENAIVQVFPSAANYQITITKDFDTSLPSLLMQRIHLSEVFVNVLQNAREAIEGKGNIIITASHAENYAVQITVSDDGPGIPENKVERIFESYFTTKEKGTGLGLAIARHNAEIYGGTIRAESKLGTGAKFIVKFPSKMLIKFD